MLTYLALWFRISLHGHTVLEHEPRCSRLCSSEQTASRTQLFRRRRSKGECEPKQSLLKGQWTEVCEDILCSCHANYLQCLYCFASWYYDSCLPPTMILCRHS
ncbi:Hypothetical predicted protein [Pelobates cultripes]|uniref:Uncharacterized protein n=1 Tax=Pelobates cultripes TaxID=61616 RepID=A0AAD1T5L8_PELCU|nr:Hypothetical predicted protein [Pelobates cultripes]